MSHARTSATMLAICTLYASSVYAEGSNTKTTKIPLKTIWAYQMPGTRPMIAGSRGDNRNTPESELLGEIRGVLRYLPNEREPRIGFAVEGKELKALRAAHAILVEKKPPRQTLPTDGEISVVFFSHLAGSYVHLCGVVRRGNVVEIQYRYVPHVTREMTNHFAIIPLGKLPPGKVRVEINQVGRDGSVVKLEGGVVCRSFSFVVADKRSD